MKKIILPVLIAATACFGLVGCNADEREKPQTVTYTVTFDSRGGSEVGSQQVLSGNPVKRPDTPEREGYVLNGWYTSAYTTADSEWHFDTDRVVKDITLYAGWTLNTTSEEITEMYITVNGNKLKVTLEDNSSVAALVEILKQGDIVFTATENGGFEIYGNIGHTLPTNNTQITAQAGDVILYAGNNICLFFGSNSWSYTRIGKINGYNASELKAMLGTTGSVQVTLSLV